MKEIIKKPSAWFPLVMSFAALILLLSFLAIYGIQKPPTPQTDEGAVARIFQLLFFLWIHYSFFLNFLRFKYFSCYFQK